MKKVLSLFIVMAVMFGFTDVISAATKLHSDFPDTITAKLGTMTSVGNAKVYKKEYTGGTFSGKAICSAFARKVPPTGTKCSLIDWTTDATKNKKIASGIAAIIKKARDLSTDVDGINWTNYLYAEMAINQFLYENNGSQADNNMAALVSKSNWTAITSASAYQQMMAAASAAYNSYGNAKLKLSNAKINVVNNGSSITSASATVTAVCTDVDGNKIKCELTEKKLTSGSTSKDLNVTSSTTDKTVLSADITDIAQAAGSGNQFSVKFNAKSNYEYNVSEQYDCGSYQRLVPNIIRTTPEPLSSTATAKYTNAESLCKAVINKTDGTNVLNGAEFELYEGDSTEILESFTINNNGTYEITDLKKGNYRLVEVTAPKGYSIQTRETTFTIDDNNCTAGAQVTVVNAKQTGQLTINKVDEKGNNIAGAKIKMYRVVKNNEGIYVPEYVKFGDSYVFESGETPKVVENLIVGETYTVQEEEAPNDAYVMKKATATIVIQAGNNTVTLENSLSSFKVSKQDINSSKEIPGAHLEIFYENETSTGWSWVSTDKPQEITGLADGKYILVETTAPQGYTVAESIPFTIENGKLKDRDANTLVMKDATIIDVPDTFNMQNVIAMISGLVLVSLGTGVLFYETRKKKKA